MQSLIYKIFKPITIENIKNNKLSVIKTKIEQEIMNAQTLFIKGSIQEKQKQILLQTKNGELSTSNIPLNKNLSEKYYNDIVEIFNKYSSVSRCETIINNIDKYKKCENDKINYYKMLITLLNHDILINKVENYLYFKDTVTKEIHTTNPIYINKITNYIDEHTKILKAKIKTHCERSRKENCNNKQNGGKKTTIKKPTKKTTTKKPTKKSKK